MFKQMIRKKKSITLIAVILWMILIFALSDQSTEQINNLSLSVTERIMSTKAVFDFENMDTFNVIIKQNAIICKSAHFLLFLVLGALVYFALRLVGLKGIKVSGIAILLCVLYAISDELHQIFVPGRTAQVMDVLIDTAGAVVGIGVAGMMAWMKSRKNHIPI